MECPREVRPCGDFFLLKKEPMFLRKLVRFGSSIPVEAVKACALVGLHMMAEEDSWQMDSDSSFSSSSSRENNVGNGAFVCHRAAWIWRRNCPIPARLGGGKGGPELPYSPGHVVPGIA